MKTDTPGSFTLDMHAASFARVALANLVRELPHKIDHLLMVSGEWQSPRIMHPAFYGSYDWHSSVHMHWLLARLLRLAPGLSEAPRIRELFDLHFTPANIAAEAAYLSHPARQSFERTYGWAWLLKLQTELMLLAEADLQAGSWRDALQPLADVITERYLHYLPLADYPVRAGTHANSAFGLLFALDHAERIQHIALRKLIAAKANQWFGRDRRYPARYEPGGEDFLSGGLLEAVLMQRVIDGCSYADWWEVFCPAREDLLTWLTPVAVSDRSDPKLAHLDGLNLARAWCWKRLAPQLPVALRQSVAVAIDAHLSASLPQASGGDYAGTHWLASFALLALTDD
ncbi:DUF2891 domain-containing protein [Noviherbaspirillum aerium]|uniref:DUF2891 domain-containing protein n=1 Tax=Noviherbaspirillum aerium TaxID=2588497 RepID=UPI001CEF6A5D|nr:DUF2891 domain-containing protein [Noviherbaspirillum aerium]